MADSDERIYVVNTVCRRLSEEDFVEMPYSRTASYARGYAKLHNIPKEKIVAMTEDSFEKLSMSRDDEDGGDFDLAEIFEYQFGDKIYYVTESECEYFSDTLADICYEIRCQMEGLSHNLKYFKGKKYVKLRRLLKEFLEDSKKGDEPELSMKLMEEIDASRAFERIMVKEKGEL
jgi:hypothetical protein